MASALSLRRPTSVLGSPWPSAPPPATPTPQQSPWITGWGNNGSTPTQPPQPHWPWGGGNRPTWSPATPDPQYNDPTPGYPQSPNTPNTGGGWWHQATTGSNTLTPRQPVASSTYGDPNQAMYDARMRVLNARNAGLDASGNVLNLRRNVLGANGRVLSAQAGLMGPESAVLGQNANVLALRRRQNQRAGDYLRQTASENDTQRGEEEALQAASHNVGDITAVALQKQDTAAEDKRDAELGVSAPVDVNLPAGTTGLPGGVRAAARTQEDYLGEKTKNARALRGFNLQAAHIALQQTGNDVDAAQLVADQLGLDVDHARLLVEQARNEQAFAGNALDYGQLDDSSAGLDENRAQLDYERTQQPPQPGYVVYTDPATGRGEWLTPEERDLRQSQYLYGPEGIYSQRVLQGLTPGQARRGQGLAGATSAQIIRGMTTMGPNGQPLVSDADARAALEQQGYDEAAINLIIAEGHKHGAGAVAE